MELYKNSIPISNIYYMLCYAFSDLQEQNTVTITPEEFDNIYQLMAEIVIRGVSYQLKKGLMKTYELQQDELSGVRGRINISDTVKSGSNLRHKLICDYDEYSEDNIMNRIIKSVMLLLLRSDIKKEQADELRILIRFFSSISAADLVRIRWDGFTYHRNQGNYRLLMTICRIICENMIYTTDSGEISITSFSESNLNRLYEKFLLNYYIRHFPMYAPASKAIKWDIIGNVSLLPEMRSDIMLTNSNKRLIIDAKFYSRTTQNNYDKDSFHSGNMYQIYTYVKNEAAHFGGEVSGMLLYARTKYDIIPHDGVALDIGGNTITVRSLDLSGSFDHISKQLNDIIQ